MGQHAEYGSIAHAALVDEACELGARALHFGMHSPCANEQSTTIFGKKHSPRAAFEQFHAELAFQLVYRPRNRRLGAKQRGAGPIRAALIGNREECSQVAQLGLHLCRGPVRNRDG